LTVLLRSDEGEDNRAYGIYSGSELTIVPTQRSVGCKRSQTTWRKENVNIRRKSSGMILVTGCFLPIAASAQDMSIKSAEVSDAGDLQAKSMPAGAIQSRTDFGTGGYGGPCSSR